MTAPIAVQLYSLREALAQDFEGVIRQLADMGYAGVEPFGLPDAIPPQAPALFKSLGLQVVASHSGLPLGDQRSAVLDAAAALGLKYLICPWMDPNVHFASLDAIKRLCDTLNEASAAAKAAGLTMGYHNHHFEFEPVEGQMPYQVMLRQCAPDVIFEIDTYWVKTAGHDPAAVVKEFGARAPLLHIKDGPCVHGEPMVAVGEGVVDVPAVIQAGEGHTEWLVVELDRCATDMTEAVRKSYAYLVKKGLARGNKRAD
ncbi:MAG: sugar phosphate isomerase/epimerase [Anaerolineae bacterium]|nr:sugar phosphate isomerase/epimerase [Anaerolineae bacterium]